MRLKDAFAFLTGSNTPGAIEERRLLRQQLDEQMTVMQQAFAPEPQAGAASPGQLCAGCAEPFEPGETWCAYCGRQRVTAAPAD